MNNVTTECFLAPGIKIRYCYIPKEKDLPYDEELEAVQEILLASKMTLGENIYHYDVDYDFWFDQYIVEVLGTEDFLRLSPDEFKQTFRLLDWRKRNEKN